MTDANRASARKEGGGHPGTGTSDGFLTFFETVGANAIEKAEARPALSDRQERGTGVDLETVRDVLGQNNVTTTAIYLHAVDERKRRAAKRLKLV